MSSFILHISLVYSGSQRCNRELHEAASTDSRMFYFNIKANESWPK